MKISKIVIVFIALGAMVLAGCNFGHPQSKTKVIKVGAVIPLTGQVATYGESLKKGFEIAVAEDSGRIKIVDA